ncbi:MAG: WYL domain-containing protein [Balneola sp.]
MSINKNALLRYQVLDRCFSNPGRNYFIDDLLHEVNKALEEYNGKASQIKRRQLFDDIRFMESDQGWSIPLNRLKDGRKVYYRYSDSNFTISRQPLNDSELNQISSAISVLSRFAGAPQFEWVQELLPVLKDRFDIKTSSKEVISLESNIDLKGIEHLTPLYDAIIKEQVLTIEYQDFKSESIYSYTFHPYYLKQYNNRWFVIGLNKDHDIGTWTVALDRIQKIDYSTAKYISSETNWNDYFFDIIGVTRPEDADTQKIIFEFTKEQAPYVITKPIHPTQKHEWNDDMLQVSIEVIPNYELESLILSFGEKVKVLEPESLKDRISNRAHEASEIYD